MLQMLPTQYPEFVRVFFSITSNLSSMACALWIKLCVAIRRDREIIYR